MWVQSKLLGDMMKFVIFTTKRYNIDESHGIGHSLDVLRYADSIYHLEKLHRPNLVQQQRIIYTAATLHDMCDQKYMTIKEGLDTMDEFLRDKLNPHDKRIALTIMDTMSYSKVKSQGFPDLGEYQWAYHIVREADLLAGYSFERSLIYHMCRHNRTLDQALQEARNVFHDRILKYKDENLFFTAYGRYKSTVLHDNSIVDMYQWNKLIQKTVL